MSTVVPVRPVMYLVIPTSISSLYLHLCCVETLCLLMHVSSVRTIIKS